VNSIADVSAAVSETTGELRITSDVSGGDVSLSDTSGLLAALRIPTGIHQGSQEATSIVETQTGTTTITNSTEVADRISEAVDKVNEALRDVSKVRDDIQGRLDVAIMVQDAIASLRDKGLQGLNFSSSDMRVSMDREKLVRSLDETLAGEEDVYAAIGKLLDQLSTRTATPASAGEQSTMPSRFQFSNLKAQVMAGQVTRTLNLLSVIGAYNRTSRSTAISGNVPHSSPSMLDRYGPSDRRDFAL